MIAASSHARLSPRGARLRRASALIAIALAAVACEHPSGITAPSDRRDNNPPALSVDVSGPAHVEYEDDYTYTAAPYGGVGGYTYTWHVYRPQTGWTQMSTTSSTATIHIAQGEGEAWMRVVVASGSATAEGFKFTTNGIGCEGDYCPIDE